MTMRIAVGQAARATDEYLAFARQIGAAGIQLNTPDLPGDERWELADLLALRERIEAHGLRLEAIENVPNQFYENAMLGREGRDQEIASLAETIRNLGSAGIPILGFHWMPASVWRTQLAPVGRGNAVVSGFDLAAATGGAAGAVYVARRDLRADDQKDTWIRGGMLDLRAERGDEDMWASFEYFVGALAPVAEEAGVRLALHPDDPPVPSLGGVARIFRSVDALKRAADHFPGPGFAIELCLGTVSEMGGEEAVLDAIRYLAPRDKIAYVHLRDVQGTVPSFVECFLGEGNYRPARVLRELRAQGFSGFILDDHTPALINDSAYGHRGRALALGYIQGVLDMLETYDDAGEGRSDRA